LQIQIRLCDDDNRNIDIFRIENAENVWQAKDDDVQLRITLNEIGAIQEMELGQMILSSRDEIAERFLTALADIVQIEAAGIEYSEAEHPDPSTPFPYDPDAIRVDTKQFNIGLIHEMINDGDVNLSPDFQRQFVWTNLGARSRLIESIMLRIPLPVFYMAQDTAGRLHVVDGLQRLTVINQFLNSELRLRDLEYLTEETGKVFRHADPARCINQKYRKRILQTQIMVNIIDPQTPSEVKFDIFKRINQGGRPLNAQEMRNCMSIDSSRALVTSLAKGEDFLLASDGSVGTVRMQDQELIVRFLAFRLMEKGLMPSYPGNMESYLDRAVDVLNDNNEVHQVLADEFSRSMRNNYHLFGHYAFRKCLSDDLYPGRRRRLINNSYFTTWSTVLASYHESDVEKIEQGDLAYIVAERLEIDDQFRDAVTAGTNDRRRLEYAFQVTRALCEEIIE
jgi:Protein of unknown function DUF262